MKHRDPGAKKMPAGSRKPTGETHDPSANTTIPSPEADGQRPIRPARILPAGIEQMLKLDDLAVWLNCSRRWLEAQRAAGRVPRADFQIGRSPRWLVSTILRWIEAGGRS
jgi:hypothetical protein